MDANNKWTKWTCSVNGDNITYTPKDNQVWEDTCKINVTDGDTTKSITVTWKWIDTWKPTCTITQAACTSGSLTLTLTASENIATPNGWSVKTANTVFTKSVTANGTVSAEITDA